MEVKPSAVGPLTEHRWADGSIGGNANGFLKTQKAVLSRAILADLDDVLIVNILKVCDVREYLKCQLWFIQNFHPGW